MECAICFHSLSEDHRVLPCNHAFHHACIESWFERSTTCPLCRFNLENNPGNGGDLSNPQVLQAFILYMHILWGPRSDEDIASESESDDEDTAGDEGDDEDAAGDESNGSQDGGDGSQGDAESSEYYSCETHLGDEDDDETDSGESYESDSSDEH